MMKLHIKLPDNLITKSLTEQSNIPCLCKISQLFEIVFQDPLPEATGWVEGWSSKEIDGRAPAGAGGKYTHYKNALVSLKKIDEELYEIIDLSFFCSDFGWCPILKNGELCELLQWVTQEELDAIEASLPPIKSMNKKQRKLMEALAKLDKEE